jgi:hypothetical protein
VVTLSARSLAEDDGSLPSLQCGIDALMIDYTATDRCGAVTTTQSVTSGEPVTALVARHGAIGKWSNSAQVEGV